MLYTFDSVTSAATTTIPAFKSIMSTWLPESEESWYDCTTLPEIMRSAGYKTIWISNQSKKGLFDNVIGEYAELCDTNLFVGNKYAGLNRTTLDEEVIPLIRPFLEDTASYKFYVIHLMGSHGAFKNRYPADFWKFGQDDYPDRKEKQRNTLAEYDNSVAYNDSIVYEIMELYREQEAIIIYFSDHGLDIYISSDNYAAHGKENVPKSAEAARQIPFWVYMSPRYQKNFIQKAEKIKGHVHSIFRTDDIIYTVMDIAGISFTANNDVMRCSLFQEK